jgi:hypothetical protein
MNAYTLIRKLAFHHKYTYIFNIVEKLHLFYDKKMELMNEAEFYILKNKKRLVK